MRDIFFYRVLIAARHVKVGLLRSTSEQQGRAQLMRKFQAVHVISLQRIHPVLASAYNASPFNNERLSVKELIVILRQLSILLKAGVPIDDCLQNLIEDAKSSRSRGGLSSLTQLDEDLKNGLQLSACMDLQPETFPRIARCLAQVGDQTGCIDEALMDASKYIEKAESAKSGFKRAMIYPVTTFLAMFGAAAFWLVYVVPNMSALFKQMKVQLPPLTVATVAASDWLSKWFAYVLCALIVVSVAHGVAWVNRGDYRVFWFKVLSRVPVVGEVLLKRSLAGIFQNFGVLYTRGVDVISSLDIALDAIENDFHRALFAEFAGRIKNGHPFGASMGNRALFPSTAATVISAGERSGTLGTQFLYLSNIYNQELDEMVAKMSEIIKPLVVVVAGGFFIFMIVALLLPIYDLIKQTMAAMN
jgi:type II secretory pathway component PulF